MVTNDQHRPTKQRGRTLWDYLHENPWVVAIFFVTTVHLILKAWS